MIKKACWGFLQVLAAAGAGLVIIAVIASWRLSQGPISLGFLTPYIQQSLNASHGRKFTLAMDDTIIAWAGWERALDIRVINVRVVDNKGVEIGRVPELAFALSGQALARGMIAPEAIDLRGAELQIRRTAAGGLDVGIADGGEAEATGIAGRLVEILLSPPVRDHPMGYLAIVNIIDAAVTVDDQVARRTWRAPRSDVSLRRSAIGITASADLNLRIDGHGARIAVTGQFPAGERRADLVFNFSDIPPAAFSDIGYDLGPLRAINLPLGGTVTVGLSLDRGISTLGFNLKGGAGSLNLPAPASQTLPVSELALRGTWDVKQGGIAIDAFEAALAPDAVIRLPAPVNHAYPVSRIAAKGKLVGATNRLHIEDLAIDLDAGAKMIGGFTVDGFGAKGGRVSVEAHGTVTGVAGNAVRQFWPKALGTDAWTWVTSHISEGRVDTAEAAVKLWSPDGEAFEVVEVNGTMRVTGATLDYLPPMPTVKNVDATMVFDDRRFDILIAGGQGDGGLKVTSGIVKLTGLDEVDQYADIDVSISGPFDSALKLIESEPLAFASKLNIDPATARGDADVDLKLKLLLAKDLTVNDVTVAAEARLRSVDLDGVVLGRSIRDGDLTLSVDNDGMDVRGTVGMGDIQVRLGWRENFADAPDFRSRYDLASEIKDVRDVLDLGLDLRPLSSEVVTGEVDVTMRYTVVDDRHRRIEADVDLTEAIMVVPPLKWAKAAGLPGRARININMLQDVISAVPRFEIEAEGLKISGGVVYSPHGTGLERIDFRELKVGRTDVRGALIARNDGGWEAGFHGPGLDLTKHWPTLWENLTKGDPEPDPRWHDLTVAVEFGRVWIDGDRVLDDVSGTFARRNGLSRTVLLQTKLQGAVPFEMALKPNAEGNRTLAIRSPDAGATLRFFQFYDNMVGGKLSLTGLYDDAAPGQPMQGRLRVDEYRITGAPLMARLLSIMALTGIVEALEGDGLAFNELDLPFTLNPGGLEIIDAKATGTSLGFTASGALFTHSDVLELRGTVIPVYALNAAVGNIPVLGDLLTGTEKGGGVFAANFTMAGPVEKPDVTVNPLSALAPGILRNIFGVFGSAGSKANVTPGGGATGSAGSPLETPVSNQ